MNAYILTEKEGGKMINLLSGKIFLIFYSLVFCWLFQNLNSLPFNFYYQLVVNKCHEEEVQEEDRHRPHHPPDRPLPHQGPCQLNRPLSRLPAEEDFYQESAAPSCRAWLSEQVPKWLTRPSDRWWEDLPTASKLLNRRPSNNRRALASSRWTTSADACLRTTMCPTAKTTPTCLKTASRPTTCFDWSQTANNLIWTLA